MERAAKPAAALADRAERHVFALLPDLPAVERRLLALLELAEADRAGAARDTGLDGEELRAAIARARKALRRRRGALRSGGRCENAELLLCDRLDGSIDRPGARWLDIHLDRCPRCRDHEQLLAAAREELRADFAEAESERTHQPAQPPPPRTSTSGRHDVQKWTFAEKEATEAGPPAAGTDRARLRVVPPAPELPPAAEPELLSPAEPPAQIDPAPPEPELPAAEEPALLDALAPEPELPAAEAPPLEVHAPPPERKLPAAEAPAPLAASPPDPQRTATEEPPLGVAAPPAKRPAAAASAARTTSRAPAVRRAARIAAIALLVAAVVVAIALALGSIGGSDTHVRAPWDQPGAPDVRPAPLSQQ